MVLCSKKRIRCSIKIPNKTTAMISIQVMGISKINLPIPIKRSKLNICRRCMCTVLKVGTDTLLSVFTTLSNLTEQVHNDTWYKAKLVLKCPYINMAISTISPLIKLWGICIVSGVDSWAI